MRRRAPLIPRCMLAGVAVCAGVTVPLMLLLFALADRGVPAGYCGVMLGLGAGAAVAAGNFVHDRLHVCSICGVKHADHNV